MPFSGFRKILIPTTLRSLRSLREPYGKDLLIKQLRSFLYKNHHSSVKLRALRGKIHVFQTVPNTKCVPFVGLKKF